MIIRVLELRGLGWLYGKLPQYDMGDGSTTILIK